MSINVHGGTAKDHSSNLCLSCVNATVRQAQSNVTNVRCSVFECLIKTNTYSCSSYKNKSDPDLYDLKQIAWIVTGDPKSKIGFTQYKKMDRDEQRKVDADVDY